RCSVARDRHTMFFGCLACSVSRRPANHLGGDSLDSRQIRRFERFCRAARPNFFHKLSDILNTLCRQFLSLLLRRAYAPRRGRDEKPKVTKTLVLSMFSATPKNCARRCATAMRAAPRASVMVVETQDVVWMRVLRRSIQRKCWCFCSAVVIGRAVFAIPAGTVRHRHSLMARRAAWRRSEGRQRRQRKRARERPSAGGRSKHALLSSL